MNKKLKIVILCSAVFVMFMLLAGLMFRDIERDPVDVLYDSGTETETVVQEPQSYVLGIYEGNIAVFYGEFQKVPAIETEIDVSTLRAVDRELLSQGIKVSTYEEVLKLLEDFGS